MRSIVCRFTDEAELLNHLNHNNDLNFLAEFQMPLGRQVEVTIMVSSMRERCRLRMHAIERTAVAIDDGDATRGARLWNYGVRVAEDDRVWLEAFLSRLRAVRTFTSPHASAHAA